jgi:hypothetical protein
VAATTQPLFWTYKVELAATNNLRWQPPDGDIEFSADLMVEQTLDSLLIYGDMKALRGDYYFLSNRFRVQRADLTFDNQAGGYPLLDAEATTRLVPSAELAAGGEGGRQQPHLITVRIRGRANATQIELVSDPADLDEPGILRELTLGRFMAGSTVALGNPLDNYLTQQLNRQLSAEMSRAFKGYISEWEVAREQGGLLRGEGDLILGVGTQVTPNLLLRYRQVVPGLSRGATGAGLSGSPFERDVEAEYRINRFFYVSTEVAQRRLLTGNPSATGGADFNVNLKARWEY